MSNMNAPFSPVCQSVHLFVNSHLFVNQFGKVWTDASQKCDEVALYVSMLLKIQFL